MTSLQHQSCPPYVDEDLSDHIELLQAFYAIMETIPLNCLGWNSNKNFDNKSGFGKDPYGEFCRIGDAKAKMFF
ncbi:hypothetical protein OUZ56_019747 [Daphnia magna]|uniref:Uncharacterized protein n=1 Tax=Daphnia magna TaxID=35525 RepID=A0ABQ9ZCI6_9CRUS|nr:hypothetical protein OUZ56_019747 [Daphnia magna]